MKLEIKFEKQDPERRPGGIESTIFKWVVILTTIGTAILVAMLKYKEIIELWKD